MLIRKETAAHFCIVKRQEGFGRKAHFTDLLRIRIKPQMLAYNPEEKAGIPYMLNFTATFFPSKPDPISLDGSWEADDFHALETNSEALANFAAGLIKSDTTLLAQSEIGNAVRASINFEDVSVSQGIFSGSEVCREAFIQLTFLGVDLGKSAWFSGMFEPVTQLIKEFEKQRITFEQHVSALIASQAR